MASVSDFDAGIRYPRLLVDTSKIAMNTSALVAACGRYGIDVCGVTKAVGGDEKIARVFVENGVSSLGDSRLRGLSGCSGLGVPRLLIRCPQVCEVDTVVRVSDVSVATDLDTVQALDLACERRGINSYGILIMCDLGDLREGVISRRELREIAEFVAASRYLYLYGVGTNLNCLSFVLPDAEKMQDLVDCADEVSEFTSRNLVVSGGNSSNLNLVFSGNCPAGVNSLRLGEALLFGRERATYRYLPGTFNDAFILQASIVEIKEKPSLPWGETGVDSYGMRHEYRDRGVRLRAVLAFGHQDCDTDVLWPLEEGVSLIDSSSDYTVVDVSDSGRVYHVGDVVGFRCGYHAVARAFASPYIEKIFI